MLLLVGLGNPGPKYAGHRHNVGFMAADEVADRYHFARARTRFQSHVAEGVIAGEKVLLLKPKTFMNESGRAVGSALRFHKLRARDIIVIHDELDLVPGKVRVKRGGGAGGHNGLRSLDSHIGKDYRRVRIGIGHPGDKNRVERYVLSDFAKADRTWLGPTIEAICEALPLLIEGDDPGFMTRVALLTRPPRAKQAGKPVHSDGKVDGG